jgi:thioredoxin:protein disulfide reductase
MSDVFGDAMGRFIAVLTMLLGLTTSVLPASAQEFLQPEKAFNLSVDRHDANDVQLTWQVAKGYYLYRDRIQVEGTPAGSVVSVDKPAAVKKHDATFGDTAVYHDKVTVHATVNRAEKVNVTWQGCAEAGICYPPQHRLIDLAYRDDSSEIDAATAPPRSSDLLSTDMAVNQVRVREFLTESGAVLVMVVFFGMGILLAFTPCVLPMLPVLSGIIVGSQARRRRAFFLSLTFVLTMAATYSALGVAAALAGVNFQAFLQNRLTVLSFGLILVMLALAMFGAFELQLPSLLRQRLADANRRQRGGTVVGAAAMGLLSALLVGPCMTAPLAGALLYIAQSGSALRGGLALLALGLGMGMPLLLVATVGGALLPKPGPWMERVKVFLGFVLLATAVWIAQRVLPAPVSLGLWGALMLAVASTLLFGLSTDATSTLRRVTVRYLGILLGLWGAAMVFGAAAGADNPVQPLALATDRQEQTTTNVPELTFTSAGTLAQLKDQLASAQAAHRAALVDFSADWCVSCRVIDKSVFGDSQVQQALADFQRVRVDVSANSGEQQDLMRAYRVMGPPTVLLFDGNGAEHRALRFVGEFGAEDLLDHLRQVERSNGK